MKRFPHLVRLLLVPSAFALAAGPAGASSSRANQTIANLQIDGRPCLFFTLSGVAEADPALPGQPYFAVPTSNPNYTTMATMIMSAKLTGRPINIQSDGTSTCGFATATVISYG